MSSEKTSQDDLRDRLIDGGLREVVGDETPPDLSEQILFAATGEHAEKLSTRARGDAAMATEHNNAVRKRNVWIGLSLAASLLVVAGLMWPTMQAARESAKSTQPVPHQLDKSGNENALGTNDKLTEESDPITVELPEFESTPVDTIVEVEDQGTVLSSGMKRIAEAREDGVQSSEQDSKSDSLMLDVTPRIIVDQVEEESLGVADGEGREERERDPYASRLSQSKKKRVKAKEQSVPALVPEAKMGLQGLVNDAYVGTQPNTSDASGLDRSKRRQVSPNMTFGDAAVPAYGVPAPGQAPAPDSQSHFYSLQEGKATGGEYGSQGGRWRWGGEFGSNLGNDGVSLGFDWQEADRDGDGRGLSQRDSGLRTRHREVSQELREKIDRYQRLSKKIERGESPTSNPELAEQYSEVRKKQAEIAKAKGELIELGVSKTLAEQQARSSSAIEIAVQEQLGKDPMLANYKTDKFAIEQQIRMLRKRNKQGSTPEIKRMEATLAQLEQEAESYRTSKEGEVRKALRTAPNDFLSTALTEHVLRRDATVKKIEKLEKEYKEKIAAIKLDGDDFSELARMESEIEQLQTLEESLDYNLRRLAIENGKGPDKSGDKYERIYENPFIEAEGERAVSTFSIDVDTASYANVRQFLMQSRQLPPADAVRIEELVNYFDYDYTAPTGDTPFAAHVEVAGCPWQAEHRLVRVGIKGREIDTDKRPQSNLVFLIDVSGSMNEPAKLPLLVEGMKMLTKELGENDRVAIVVYASSEGLALPSTRGDKQDVILAALEKLRAGGSTAGGAGIQLAYKIAKENFVEGGVNRVILATDGDFNVGTTSTAALEAMAEKNAKETGVFLTVLGFGRGNLNDSMMEKISGIGNGNYHYVDNRTEARKVMVAEMAGTLVTIAKDVKIQIEFNPAQVAAYRLIGYENRMLKTQDFNDDKKDAGEIGAGHTVTAIYELVPAGKSVETPGVDPLKYQKPAAKPQSDEDASKELLTLKLRYKQPDGDVSTKVEFPITDNGQAFAEATDDFKFASAVASFGMLLRDSEHKGNTSYSAVAEIAEDGAGEDKHGYRAEFLQMVQRAKELAGE